MLNPYFMRFIIARPKGSVAKRNITLAAFLHIEGCNPAKILADVTKTPPLEDATLQEILAFKELRFRAAQVLMPYVWPKLSNVEVSGRIETSSVLGVEPEAIKACEQIIKRLAK